MRKDPKVSWSAAIVCFMAITVAGGCAPQPAEPVAAQSAPPAAPAQPTGATRMERDLLGEKAVPSEAYYGVQTARALENFKISGIPISHYPGFIEGFVIVKLAAARANTDVGAMKPEVLAAIEKAAAALMKGRVPGSVPGGLVPGRRWHLDQHERQRGDGQRRAGTHRAPEG